MFQKTKNNMKTLDVLVKKIEKATNYNKQHNGIVGKIIYGIVIVIVLIMYFYKHNQVAYLQQEVNLQQITIAEQQMSLEKQKKLSQFSQELLKNYNANAEEVRRLEEQWAETLKEADEIGEKKEIIDNWFG